MPRLIAQPAEALVGTARVPGDKSISHRALMLAGLAVGESEISGLLEGEDVLATGGALTALGISVARDAPGHWRVSGRGIGGLCEPSEVLDLGNSGTAARLLLGVLASHPIIAVVTGDASLRGRPMARVTEPLTRMGATFVGRAGSLLPLTVSGAHSPMPILYDLPVPSAQVKSAILLAGLNTPGVTTVVEPVPTRDHSERMLRHFGAEVITEVDGQARRISADRTPGAQRTTDHRAQRSLFRSLSRGRGSLPTRFPGDDRGVGLNPARTGLFTTLEEMGAQIAYRNQREEGGEPIADLDVRGRAFAWRDRTRGSRPQHDRRVPGPRGRRRLRQGPQRVSGSRGN